MRQLRMGRPTKVPNKGTRVSLGLKVTPEIKSRLDAAARTNGRTQSQEAEARLDRTFERADLQPDVLALAYGQPVAGLVLLLADVLDSGGREAAFNSAWARRDDARPSSWWSDAYAFNEAVEAVNDLLSSLRRSGEETGEAFEERAALPMRLRRPGKRIARLALKQVLSGTVERGEGRATRNDPAVIQKLIQPLIDSWGGEA